MKMEQIQRKAASTTATSDIVSTNTRTSGRAISEPATMKISKPVLKNTLKKTNGKKVLVN